MDTSQLPHLTAFPTKILNTLPVSVPLLPTQCWSSKLTIEGERGHQWAFGREEKVNVDVGLKEVSLLRA